MRRLVLAVALAVAAPAVAQKLPVRLDEGASWTFVARHDREVVGDVAHSFSVTTSKKLTWTHAEKGGRLLMEHISAIANSGLPPEAAAT